MLSPDVTEFTGVCTPLCKDPTVSGFFLYKSGPGRAGTLKVRQGLSNLESISTSAPSAESMPGYGSVSQFLKLDLVWGNSEPQDSS